MIQFALISALFASFAILFILLYSFITRNPKDMTVTDYLFHSGKMNETILLMGAVVTVIFGILLALYSLETQTTDTTQSDIAQSSVSTVVVQSGQ